MSDLLLDARLPSPALASSRVYGHLRPKTKPPHRAQTVAYAAVREYRYEVQTNRTRTRWWLVVCRTHKDDEWNLLADFASTTSARVAQGWISAVHEASGAHVP